MVPWFQGETMEPWNYGTQMCIMSIEGDIEVNIEGGLCVGVRVDIVGGIKQIQVWLVNSIQISKVLRKSLTLVYTKTCSFITFGNMPRI